MGAEVCSRCHPTEAAQWKTTAHSHALQTLVDQKKDATPDCLPCHVTGYQQAGGYQTAADAGRFGNVQCENCHGMGTAHDSAAHSMPAVDEATCRHCHNETTSPAFSFAVYAPHIQHHPAGDLPPLPPRPAAGAMMGGHGH